MASVSRSKYLWLVLLALLAVLVYVGWGLASIFKWPKPSPLSPTQIEAPSDTDTTDDSTDGVSEEEDSPTDTGTGTATGDGVDDFGACDEYADIYCAGLKGSDWTTYAEENDYTTASWKYALLDCLEANEQYTSQDCKDSLSRREDLNEELKAACEVERGQYCQGIEPIPGSEPMVDCLKENYENLSIACAEALDAHEDAKRAE